MPFEIISIKKSENRFTFKIKQNNQLLVFANVLRLWRIDENFRSFYLQILKDFSHAALFWEHPPLTTITLNRDYECTLVASSHLDQRAIDTNSFKKYLNTNESIVDFYNLSGDARLVVPTRKSEVENYKHLLCFVRNAPIKQTHDLFQRIGETLPKEIERRGCIWLNTEGSGVIWLHVRMDTRPKYYHTQRYREIDFWIRW